MRRRAATHLSTPPLANKFGVGALDIPIGNIQDAPLGDKHRVITLPRAAGQATYFPHPPLRAVSPHRSAQLLPRNKSNTTGVVVFFAR